MQMFNTFGTSGHANVTNIGRITYEIINDETAKATYEKVASIDERLRVVHDEKSSTSDCFFYLFFVATDFIIQSKEFLVG